MNAIVKMLLTNWLTSLPGGGLILAGAPALFELLQSGTSWQEVLQSPALGKVLGGVGLLFSKDMNVTGGSKDNA